MAEEVQAPLHSARVTRLGRVCFRRWHDEHSMEGGLINSLFPS